MKKWLICVTAVLTTVALSQVPYIEAIAYTITDEQSSYSTEERKDVFKWYYRSKNGYMEKRLWNNTKGKWGTNWIPL